MAQELKTDPETSGKASMHSTGTVEQHRPAVGVIQGACAQQGFRRAAEWSES